MATNLTTLDTADTQNTLRSFLARFPFLFYAALTLLVGLTAVVFIVATRGELGKPSVADRVR